VVSAGVLVLLQGAPDESALAATRIAMAARVTRLSPARYRGDTDVLATAP
jgi:hypothetical protein